MILTEEDIDRGKSIRGGWSIAQVALLGEDRTRSGWRQRLIGTSVAEESFYQFLKLKDHHLKVKGKYKKLFEKRASQTSDIIRYHDMFSNMTDEDQVSELIQLLEMAGLPCVAEMVKEKLT